MRRFCGRWVLMLLSTMLFLSTCPVLVEEVFSADPQLTQELRQLRERLDDLDRRAQKHSEWLKDLQQSVSELQRSEGQKREARRQNLAPIERGVESPRPRPSPTGRGQYEKAEPATSADIDFLRQQVDILAQTVEEIRQRVNLLSRSDQ